MQLWKVLNMSPWAKSKGITIIIIFFTIVQNDMKKNKQTLGKNPGVFFVFRIAPGCKICIVVDMWTYLWQNFLIDAKVRGYIADKISSLYRECGGEALIEIGPWKGSITTLIDTISPNFIVIDKDPTFYENWTLNIENGTFILGDILQVDVEKLLSDKQLHTTKTLIVGNLPYYITSPILRKFFSAWQNYAGGVFMVQDEVGQKIKSDAKKKSYLRRLLNFFYEVKYLKWVSAKCFKPAPKVKSALIQLAVRTGKLNIERDKFVEFLELFAPFSRKTLWAIQTLLKKKSDISFVIPPSLHKKRLEELDRSDFEHVCK